LGLPIARAVIANMETGRRHTLTVPELLVLARALDLSPVALLFRLGSHPTAEPLPGRTAPAWDAVKWATGEAPFPGEAPSESVTPTAFYDTEYGKRIYATSQDPAGAFRVHDELITDVLRTRNSAARLRARASAAATDGDAQSWQRAAEAEDRKVTELADAIRAARQEFRRGGITPPTLPADLQHLDNPHPRREDD
jgi:hypothetical protein